MIRSPLRLFLLPLALAACAVEGGDPADTQSRGPLGKADHIGSCQDGDDDDFCGEKSDGTCWCDDQCVTFGDCCADKAPVCDGLVDQPKLCMNDNQCGADETCDHSKCLSNCPDGMFCPAVCWGQCLTDVVNPDSCEDQCGNQAAGGCWCDTQCHEFGDCCDDVEDACADDMLTCEELGESFLAEAKDIRSCTSDDECGQVLAGTSCGCTRNWVARSDADLTEFEALRSLAGTMGCMLPGTISTCDCPAADGFACEQGTCTWNYL